MNKNKSLVFINVAIHFARYQYAIGKKLEEKGVNVSYVTYSKEAEIFLKKRNANATYIPDIIDKYVLKKPIEEYLKEIEEKYDVNTNLILFGDYDHSLMRREKAFESMIKNFMFWEDYLKNRKVDSLIGGAERFVGIIPYIVSKKYNAKYFCWTRAVIPNHFVITQEQKFHHGCISQEYWNKHKNEKLTFDERKKAKEIIRFITEKKETVYLVIGIPKVTIGQILFFFKRLYLNIFVEKFRNPYARVVGIAWDKTKKAIRKYFAKLFYSKPDYQEKYIFYPMHLGEDLQLLVRAPQYALTNQTYLIEYTARCLPAGCKLYVKEHPNNIGGTSLGILKRIKRIPNVRLISPFTQSHDLIKNAAGIITINSTVGWEGLLYKKPVITFGPCFYEISELAYSLRNLYELPEIIKKALKNEKFDEEKLLRFVNAVLKTIHPGNLNFYYKYAKKAMQDENISLIAEGIYKELNKK